MATPLLCRAASSRDAVGVVSERPRRRSAQEIADGGAFLSGIKALRCARAVRTKVGEHWCRAGPLAQLVERRSFKPCGSGFEPRAAHQHPVPRLGAVRGAAPRVATVADEHEHEDEAAAAAADEPRPGRAEEPPVDPSDEEHMTMGAALDDIEAALDDAAATIARMA